MGELLQLKWGEMPSAESSLLLAAHRPWDRRRFLYPYEISDEWVQRERRAYFGRRVHSERGVQYFGGTRFRFNNGPDGYAFKHWGGL
ncbi:unnamed protein product, partial [Iphiclides podalirius]